MSLREERPQLRISLDARQRPALDEAEIRNLAEPLIEQERLTGEWLLEVRFVDRATIRQLNQQAQGLDEPTDVLSFPVHFATTEPDPHRQLPAIGPQLLGSIVIAPEVAAEQATGHRRSIDGELRFLLDHGLRHLLGYDHDDRLVWYRGQCQPARV